MSNTMMGIILVVYLIVLAILIWVGHKHNKLSAQAINFAGKSYEDVSALVDFLTARNKRDHEVAQLFAGILFDLCHATDKNVLQWKLSMLRNLDFVMNLAGYDNVYDDNFYTWMYNTLTQVPKNVQVAQLQKIRENVKGYYIMDTEVGKNFCDVIADIINMNSNMSARHIRRHTKLFLLQSVMLIWSSLLLMYRSTQKERLAKTCSSPCVDCVKHAQTRKSW